MAATPRRPRSRRQAIALAIVRTGPGGASQVLGVRRPDDPEDDLAGLWGLPAATLGSQETEDGALERLATEKLGLAIHGVRLLRRGSQRRDGYVLHMAIYEAAISEDPNLPLPWSGRPGVTHYQGWCWMTPVALTEASNHGSLCARLYLDELGMSALP